MRTRTSAPRRSKRATVGVLVLGVLAGLLVPLAPLGAAPSAHAAVPVASGDNAVITVKVGGSRDVSGAVRSLAGVTLQLFRDGTSGPGTRVTDAWGSCTSDAAGDCSFVVPNTGQSWVLRWYGLVLEDQANRNSRFWIVAQSAPSGWSLNDTLRTGVGTGATSAATPYRFRTGTDLRAGRTYESGQHFMTDVAETIVTETPNATDSGGIWQVSRSNPAAQQHCGLDVAFVLDFSGSVAPQENALVRAAASMVNALVGTPSRASFATFSTVSPSDGALPNTTTLSDVATQSSASSFIGRFANGVSPNYTARWAASGGTNWDAGFRSVAAVNTGSNVADVVVFVTDGNPSYFGTTSPAQGPGAATTLREVEEGIFSANTIREQGSRIIALGVGAGVESVQTQRNLAAISGATLGSDFYQSADYTQAAQVSTVLRNLASGSCSSTVTVTKTVVADGAPVSAATPASGWSFTAASQTSGLQLVGAATAATDPNGRATFGVTMPGTLTTGTVQVTEAAQSGYQLLPINNAHATCTRSDTGAAVTVTNVANGFRAAVPQGVSLACTVVNQEQPRPATLRIDKQWVLNGVTIANGSQPSWLSAVPTLSGRSTAEFGTTYSGYVRAQSVTIGETVGGIAADRPGCIVAARTITNVNGAATSTALGSGFALTLVAGANSVTITNTVTCSTTLTLVKQVQGGAANPSAWTLTATGPQVISGNSGTTAVSGRSVTADATYVLAESGGSALYTQQGQWSCVALGANGSTVATTWADARDDRVQVPVGMHARCTVTNATASLVLLERIEGIGTVAPSDFSLTATPSAHPSLTTTTVPGSAAISSTNTTLVRPGHAYALRSTSGVAHVALRVERYTAAVPASGAVDHENSALWATVDPASITVAPGQTAVYRFVATAPTPLTLPLTGGLGSDAFIFGGSALLLLATALLLIRNRMRRPEAPLT